MKAGWKSGPRLFKMQTVCTGQPCIFSFTGCLSNPWDELCCLCSGRGINNIQWRMCLICTAHLPYCTAHPTLQTSVIAVSSAQGSRGQWMPHSFSEILQPSGAEHTRGGLTTKPLPSSGVHCACWKFRLPGPGCQLVPRNLYWQTPA